MLGIFSEEETEETAEEETEETDEETAMHMAEHRAELQGFVYLLDLLGLPARQCL